MSAFANSIALTIGGLVIWIFLAFLIIKKGHNSVTKYFKISMIVLFLQTISEFAYTYMACYYPDNIEAIFYLCLANIYLMSATSVSLFLLLLGNIIIQNRDSESKKRKLIRYIAFIILYIAPLFGAVLIGDVTSKYDTLLNLYFVYGNSFDFIIMYDLVLFAIIIIYSIKYRNLMKNMNIYPMIIMMICYVAINAWMYATGKSVNETVLFFACFYLASYLTFESQDNALLYEYMDAKNKSEDSNNGKTQFLINMSHQIRTPLSKIIGYSDMMLLNNSSNDEVKLGIETIHNESKVLKDLIENILDVSKIESKDVIVNQKEYKLNTIISNLNSIIYSTINENGKFGININQGVPSTFIGDEELIYKILSYIILYTIERNKLGTTNLIIDGKDNGEMFDFTFIITTTGNGITKEDINLKINDYVKDIDDKEPLKMVVAKELIDMLNGSIEFIDEGNEKEFQIKLSQKKLETNTNATAGGDLK